MRNKYDSKTPKTKKQLQRPKEKEKGEMNEVRWRDNNMRCNQEQAQEENRKLHAQRARHKTRKQNVRVNT
jgi:hypothetical protein